jgi:hypothetical protein
VNLLQYNDYILEKQIFQLILESKIIYSKKFINILSKMKSNRLANELLNLYSTDVDGLVQNYIDITDEKDSVSFTPDRKVQELTKDKPQTWEVTHSGKYLTTSSRNDKIFERLGYDKEKYGCWAPETGTIGTILGETVSRQSGNIYIMFQEYGVSTPRIGVINKTAVQESEGVENMRVWSTSRNPIKIGRLIRAILTKAEVSFTDKDIEDFTKTYKATYDFMKDALKQFDVIQGKKIAYWYERDNYVSGGGTLNNSCMADVETSEYFDIYCYNPQVSLVILYSDDGKIDGEKYTSDKIKGRAILWDANINGKEGKFMDRVYTRFDSDVDLFKQFAEKNGWWYKKSQSMEPSESITNGLESASNPKIVVQLKDGCWDHYPYCDTMCYLDTNDDTLTNREVGDRMLRDTGGGWDEVD